MVIILVVVMLLFGAKKIPELARGIGKSMGEFKKAKTDFEKELSLGEKEAEKKSEKSHAAGESQKDRVG
jgi:TatA/E family protein of Tat protein translocase